MRKQTRLAAALAIRDAAVCIVHRQGVIKEYEGRKGHAPKKYVGATFGPFKISYRTPFQPQPAIRERDKYIAAPSMSGAARKSSASNGMLTALRA